MQEISYFSAKLNKSKKINDMFLRHSLCHLQPPPHQNLMVYTSQIISLGGPSFAAILFFDWLVHILKVRNFSGNYLETSFYGISFKKIKNKKLLSCIIF